MALERIPKDFEGSNMSLIYPKESLSVYPKHLSPEYRSTVNAFARRSR